jgi:hypothetical protein
MRPFISFYGGKFRQALRLPEPRYPLIIEPFAGSLGYSVRHGAGRKVFGIERDPVVAGVWRYLLTASPDDIRALPLLQPDDDLRTMTDIDQHARDLMGFWVNKGMTAPCNRPSKWMREWAGIKPETFWGAPVRDRIAEQLAEIADWYIIEGDYTLAPDVEATWLIDPPYQRAGQRYKFGAKGIDYTALAEWCRSRRGQVIVCEHTDADWLPFQPVTYDVKAARSGGGNYSAEAMWTQ